MCKEILSIHIGQSGVQSSHALWELICIEHGIGADGKMRDGHNSFHDSGENIAAMYSETKNSQYVPRALLMDLEPTVVDEVRSGAYRQLWNPSNIINQKEDAASNYARGFYTSGKAFLGTATERINREIERCDNLSAFEIVHSFAGGTGSGFSSLLSETLSDTHGKVFKFSLGVFPSPRLSEIMVESYNAVLHTHTTLENEDCVIVFDNESLFKKSLEKLKVSQPTFSLMNRLISQMFSSVSLSHRYRFFGSQHADVTELLTNLVPYPRIHFPIMSYAPIISYDQQNHELFNCSRLTTDVFQDYNHVLQCSLQQNKFMSCCMLYRGAISPKPIIDAVAKIKTRRDIQFVDWCPTGFKIGINTCPPIQVPNCEQAIGDNALCMICGSTAIRQSYSGLATKFDMLISKRAFVHWYVQEGIEEGEFLDAREDIQSLILDYEELTNQNTQDLSNETNDYDNNKTNTNVSNINNYVLTNLTNKRYTKDLFGKKLSRIYFPDDDDDIDDLEMDISPTVNQITNRNINNEFEKKFGKNRSAVTNSDLSKTTSSKIKTKNTRNSVDKCKKPIVKSQKIIEYRKPITNTAIKRTRNRTKELEIKDIRSTVKKYLGVSNPMNFQEKDMIIQKSFQIPVKRKPTVTDSMIKISKSLESALIDDSDINTSPGFYSSKEDFIEKYGMMKNNNKDKSNTTSFTGSYKTAEENSKKQSTKSKNKSIIVNQLLYRSIDKRTINCLNKNIETIHSAKNENLLLLSKSKESHISSTIKFPEKSIINIDENKSEFSNDDTLKQNFNFDNTKIFTKIKEKQLEFSKLEIIFCEPLFIVETNTSIDMV